MRSPISARVAVSSRPRNAATARRRPEKADLAEPRRRGSTERLRVRRRRDEVGRHAGRRVTEGVQVPRAPGIGAPTHARVLVLGQERQDALEQHPFVDPAARERVEGQDVPHDRPGARRFAPSHFEGPVGARTRRARLVQEHDDRAAHPREQIELGSQVARVLRRLRRIDQVEQHVGLVARGSNGLLAAPEGTVGEAIPDLGEQPAHRVRFAAQPAQQADRVAEPRRVVQTQARRVGLDQRVDLARVRHVRFVPHLAHVAPKERAGEGGLPDIRVRDEPERDLAGGTHRAGPSARSRCNGVRPRRAAMRFQASRRSSRRRCSTCVPARRRRYPDASTTRISR